MDDYNLFIGNKKRKYYYFLLIGVAFLVSLAVYLFFSSQPSVYKSSGKFAVFYDNNSASSVSGLQTSTDLTNSIAQTVKSRFFLEQISQASGVVFDSKDLDGKIDNIVKADVVTNSNILEIEFYNRSIGNLDKINDVFLDQLNESKIVSGSSSHVAIQTIDPLYTSPSPTFPKPMTYALVIFVVIIVAGLLLIYSFTP